MNTSDTKINNKPIRDRFLPFHQPLIEEEEIQEVIDTLKSGWITIGPKTKRFEQKFQQYIGCKHAIAVNSCTAAMHLALAAKGIGPGDEVITTPYTFASTVEVIIQLGAKPVFVDVGSNDFTMDVTKIKDHVTSNTKAIIPVHVAGKPCDMEEIITSAKENNLLVLEDAAHAVGAEYKGKKIGNIGDVTAFSFYATKNLTTGEGGMVTTNSRDLAERMRLLSLHGISNNAWKRYTSNGSWYYEILYPGYKYNMTDIQASLGLNQLAKLDQRQQIREQYANIYNEAFANMPEIIPPPQANNYSTNAWHLYIIRLKLQLLKITRDEFIKALSNENIGTSVHFIPIHLHPYYQKNFGFRYGDFPNAEDFYKRAISLPLYPKMIEQDIRDVISAVKKIVDNNRKP